MRDTLRRVLADDQISLSAPGTTQAGPASPLRPEVLRVIEQAKEKVWPGLLLTPVMETGATDGLFFRQRGIPTYGIGGGTWDLDDIRAHGKDERVGVTKFYHTAEFEYQLIKAIGAEPK